MAKVDLDMAGVMPLLESLKARLEAIEATDQERQRVGRFAKRGVVVRWGGPGRVATMTWKLGYEGKLKALMQRIEAGHGAAAS